MELNPAERTGVGFYSNLTPKEYAEALRSGLKAKRFILIVGLCRVDYEGRATSKLDWGERVTMIKADASILVHRPAGHEPVNWQPAGSLIRVEEVTPGAVKIRAIRPWPREVIEITYSPIYALHVAQLTDEAEFSLHVSEHDIQRVILMHPDLVERGFVPLTQERPAGSAGFVDVFGKDREGNFLVVEIKRRPADREAISQLSRYVKQLSAKLPSGVRGVILAPEIRREALLEARRQGFEFKPISLRKCAELLRAEKGRKLTEFTR